VFFVTKLAKQLFEKFFLRHLWEDLHLFLWEDLHLQVLWPFIVSCYLAPLGQKKPKPLIPQRGTIADQIICSVRLSHLCSYLPPWTRESKDFFELLPFSVPSKTIICYLCQDLLLVLNEYFWNVINQMNFQILAKRGPYSRWSKCDKYILCLAKSSFEMLITFDPHLAQCWQWIQKEQVRNI